MKAVVASPGVSPIYREFTEPQAAGDAVVLRVKAAAMSHLTRMRASGGHYSSASDGAAFVVGVDGVGVDDAGKRCYFLLPRAPFGGFAEAVLVDRANCIALPDDIDDATAAAIAIPGMSSWTALRERANLPPGGTVLINGATGSSGRLAVGIARHLGAAKIVATGRNSRVLDGLAATGAEVSVVSLRESASDIASRLDLIFSEGVDVVLDYLWGPSAEAIFGAIVRSAPPDREIRFVQIGNITGPTISFAAPPLRSKPLVVVGSGLGSVSNVRLIGSIGGFFAVASSTGSRLETREVPLAEFASVWSEIDANERIVFLP